MVVLRTPYLLFLGDAPDPRQAKTASGIYYWRPEFCVGQIRLPGCTANLGLPDLDVTTAAARGVKSLVIGLAPVGGDIPQSWIPTFEQALGHGLDVVSGMHTKLSHDERLMALAQKGGVRLIDLRQGAPGLPIGTGRRRIGKRLLTVGTDCGVGKMFAALAQTAEMKRRGLRADFRATGQTGIMIAGDGICVDAVISDFCAGATELLSPDNEPDHWDVVEGQGSLFHPSYAGVSLALLHGSQPDRLVMCHDAARRTMAGVQGFAVPSLEDCIRANIDAARLVNPAVTMGGICINTSSLDEAAAKALIRDTSDRLSLPACDPVRTGVTAIVDHLCAT